MAFSNTLGGSEISEKLAGVSSSPRRCWTDLHLLIVPFALGLAVAVVGSGERQLWRDEHATWWAATLSLDDLRRLVVDLDAAKALYYLLMHFWVEIFGSSEMSMRFPSALFVGLAAAMVTLVGRRIFDPRVGLVAGVLLTLVPSVSYYGQEARPYAMTLLAGVAATWLLLRAVERPSILRWIGYAFSLVWLGSSNLVALLLVPAHLALGFESLSRRAHPQRPGWWRRLTAAWLMSVLLATALLAPLIVVSSSQAGQLAWVPDPNPQRILQFASGVFSSAAVAGFFVATGALALAVMTTRPQRIATAVAFFLWTLVPPVAACLTFGELRLFFPRYFLFTVPGWVLLVAYLVAESLPRRRELLAGLLAVTSALVYLGLPAHIDIRERGLGRDAAFREAAGYIAARAERGDGIVFTGYDFAHRGFRYEWRRIPLSDQPREVLVSQAAEERYSWKHPDCTEAAACLVGTDKIWLVSVDPTGSPLQLLPSGQRKTVSEGFRVASTVRFHRLWVSQLVRRTN